MSGHKCPAKVYAPGAWTPHTCMRTAALEFGNQWFCKTHHPPTVKANKEAKQQAFVAEFSAKMARNAAERKAKAKQARRAKCFDDLLAALKAMLKRDERNTCQHDETERVGAIWTICTGCGLKWADDRGGKPEWQDPEEWNSARAAISKAEGAPS